MKKITALILLLVFAGCTSGKKETTANKDKTTEKEKVKKGAVPAAESSGDLCQGDACPGAVR